MSTPKSTLTSEQAIPETQTKSRYIPLKTKRMLFKKANYQCEFVSEKGVRCVSVLNLQVEHIEPFSVSQKHLASNMKILCQQHNLYAGIKFFGVKKMNRYLQN